MKSAAEMVFNIENRMGTSTYVFDNPEDLSEIRVSNNVGEISLHFLADVSFEQPPVISNNMGSVDINDGINWPSVSIEGAISGVPVVENQMGSLEIYFLNYAEIPSGFIENTWGDVDIFVYDKMSNPDEQNSNPDGTEVVPDGATKKPKGFDKVDGYGFINANLAFELLLDKKLPKSKALGGNQWTLDQLNVPDVWRSSAAFPGVTGKGITIAVIDTGVDLDHPAFKGRIVKGYDFVNHDDLPDDDHGHGTHVAGTIAASRKSSKMTGVAYNANIMPLKVVSASGNGRFSDVVDAIYWAVEHGADVINMSLTNSSPSRGEVEAIRYASKKGTVVVTSAGNEYKRSPGYPAAHAEEVGIAVGAVDKKGQMAAFSNLAGGKPIDYVTAPGVNILSAIPGGRYAKNDGTSMAAPHVAGVAALMKEYKPRLSPSEIENILTFSASNGRNGSLLSSVTDLNKPISIDTITFQSLKDFSQIDLKEPLIAGLKGSKRRRKKTSNWLQKKIAKDSGVYAFIESFSIIDSTKYGMAVLEIENSVEVDPRDVVKALLKTKKFEYIELEQSFTV